MTASSVSLENEVKARGYMNFEIVESAPSVCVLRDDNTMIVVGSTVQKVIETDSDEAEICFSDTVIAYTGKKARFGEPRQEEKELEFDMIQEGRVVCKLDNGVTVSLMPIIMQVNRVGARLSHGEERYDVVSVTKTRAEPAPK